MLACESRALCRALTCDCTLVPSAADGAVRDRCLFHDISDKSPKVPGQRVSAHRLEKRSRLISFLSSLRNSL